jgi:hypothetical protein
MYVVSIRYHQRLIISLNWQILIFPSSDELANRFIIDGKQMMECYLYVL